MKFTKNALISFFSELKHISFIFDVRLTCELKYTVHLSKTACEIFDFQLCFSFINVYFFVHQKLGLINRHNSFKN